MISINQVGEKIANLLGDTKDYGSDISRSINDFRKLSDYEPFQTLLPYQTYDEVRKYYINDQSVGFGLELLPLTGCSEDEVNRLVSMFNEKLPDKGDLHVQLISSNKIGNILDKFLAVRAKDNISSKLALKRVEYYIKSTMKSVNSSQPFYIKDYRLFIYYSEPVEQNIDMQLDVLDGIRESWKTSLRSMTIVKDLEVKEFMANIKEILNPNNDVKSEDIAYRKYDRISQQIINSNTSIDINENNIRISNENSDKFIQCFNVDSYPEKAALWQIGENIGKALEPSLQLSCPVIINVHIRAIDKTKSREKAQNKFMLGDSKANSSMSRIMPIFRKQHDEWAYLREILTGNERLVQVSYQITAISDHENLLRDSTRLKDTYSSNNWRVNLDRYLQLPSFLQCFPFVSTSGLFKDLEYFERTKIMTMFNAVNIMPFIAEWKGIGGSDGLMFVGRRGQIANWSNFANRDGNYNIAIAAKSRSGKSFLMQELIFDVLSQGGIVRVIDLGRSYEKFCKFKGGQYIEMKKGVCINPFTHVKDMTESIDQITSIIATMAHPNSDTNDKESSFISSSVQRAWDKKQNKATVTDVIHELSEIKDSVASDLVIFLEKYGKGGQYESYFEGDSTIDINNPFIVLEMEDLKNKQGLKAVVVLSIMLQITEEFYGLSKDIRKLCVIDEAWDLLHSSEQAAKFIESGYRRVAKQNGAFATIVQSVNDYFKNEMAMAVYENSDSQLILAQRDSTIDNLKNNDRLKLTPYEERLLRSFAGTPEYKECLIRTPSCSGVFRVLFDPFTRILYSTNAEEFSAVDKLQASGMSMEDAVEIVSKEVYGE